MKLCAYSGCLKQALHNKDYCQGHQNGIDAGLSPVSINVEDFEKLRITRTRVVREEDKV